MNRTLPELEDIVRTAMSWTYLSESNVEVEIPKLFGNIIQVSNAELTVLHEDLPFALACLMNDQEEKTGDRSVLGNAVYDTLKLMRGQCLRIQGLDKKERIFESLLTMGKMDEDVVIHGRLLLTKKVLVGDQFIELAYDSTAWRLRFEPSYLDTTFSGWNERYAAATALDMPVNELMVYVFNIGKAAAQAAPSVTIPELNIEGL